jgi:hypothetical protein
MNEETTACEEGSAPSPKSADGLNNWPVNPDRPRVAKTPKGTIKIRRPNVGDEVYIKVKVEKVVEPEGAHHGPVTYRAPGVLAPNTVDARYFVEGEK